VLVGLASVHICVSWLNGRYVCSLSRADFDALEELEKRGSLFLYVGTEGGEGKIKVRGQSFVRNKNLDTSPFFSCTAAADENLGCAPTEEAMEEEREALRSPRRRPVQVGLKQMVEEHMKQKEDKEKKKD